MSDTTSKVNQLKVEVSLLAEKRNHTLGQFQDFAGGAVSIAECTKCQRFALAELYEWPQYGDDGQITTRTETNFRGSALVVDCETKKPK